MDAEVFEQMHGAFGDFHAYFAPLFGRRETRKHSGHYLQALLVQSGERRNAENLSETVPGSARGMQRFLTDSPSEPVRELDFGDEKRYCLISLVTNRF